MAKQLESTLASLVLVALATLGWNAPSLADSCTERCPVPFGADVVGATQQRNCLDACRGGHHCSVIATPCSSDNPKFAAPLPLTLSATAGFADIDGGTYQMLAPNAVKMTGKQGTATWRR